MSVVSKIPVVVCWAACCRSSQEPMRAFFNPSLFPLGGGERAPPDYSRSFASEQWENKSDKIFHKWTKSARPLFISNFDVFKEKWRYSKFEKHNTSCYLALSRMRRFHHEFSIQTLRNVFKKKSINPVEAKTSSIMCVPNKVPGMRSQFCQKSWTWNW